ncbi:MAG: hypothetical protein ABH842_05480 [Candidatus Micrarchaeota archaeon]
MNAIIELLRKKAAFSTKEFLSMIKRAGYGRVLLYRLKEKKIIVPIKNGWWAFPNSLPEAIACEMSKPCYLSFHTALFLHGLTTQSPRTIQLAVARKSKKYSILGSVVNEYKIKKEQFQKFYRKDNLLLATPEKAFSDAIHLPRSCPDIVLFEAMGSIDLVLVEALLSSKAAKKRLKRLIKNARSQRTE